jgi:hypothetical protein
MAREKSSLVYVVVRVCILLDQATAMSPRRVTDLLLTSKMSAKSLRMTSSKLKQTASEP